MRYFSHLTAAAAFLALPLGGTGGAQSINRNPAEVRARAQIIPLVDHHQHIFGPSQVDPPTKLLASVTIPADLRRLLRERERISGTTNIGKLFTNDAQVLNIFFDTESWVNSPTQIGAVVEQHGRSLRLVPTAFGRSGSSGFVSGIAYADDEGEYDKHFMLGLRRSPAGAWQIASEAITNKAQNPFRATLDARTLIMRLDDAGIQRAVVLSTAYWLASPRRAHDLSTEQAEVKAANEWTIEQASRYPTRLIPFCSVNPLSDYAVAEMDRCAQLPAVKGIKLHFPNSRVDIAKSEHLAKVREFFRATDARGLAIVLHFAAPGEAGPEYVQRFIEQVLPAAPKTPVQIAHLGSGEGPMFDRVLDTFAEAIARRDPRVANLYFDVTEIITEDVEEEEIGAVTALLRKIGLKRIFYGSDTPLPRYRPMPIQGWATFRRRMPFTNRELEMIANNVAPYLR